jgi:hypothetical protein
MRTKMDRKIRKFLASELIGVAKDLVAAEQSRTAREFDSPEALKKYLKEHPKADKSKHKVKQSPGKSTTKTKAPSNSTDFPKHRKVTPSVKSLSKVQKVLGAHKLDEESDEVGEMMGFKKTLGQRIPESQHGQFYVRNEKKLKADFLKNMNPSNYDSPEAFKKAKERIKKMPVSDFGKILGALTEEEE